MNTALAQIQEEIKTLETRLELLRTAETALLVLAAAPVPKEPGNLKWPEAATYLKSEKPAKGLAGAIREFLGKNGPATKHDIDMALHDRFKPGKGIVSGALQSMKARGGVTRTKAGKWALRS